MALTVRLARHGRKNRPHYSIVVADSRSPRDGRFVEKVGTYNPLLAKDSDARVTFNEERVKYWLSVGAQPTDRVAIFLGKKGLAEAPAQGNNPQKAKPKAKAQERVREREEKAAAAAEAAATAAAAPAEEASDVPQEAPIEEPTEVPAEQPEEVPAEQQ